MTIPPSWRQKSLVNKKGGRVASKTQQSNSLCLAVKPPPFDKGGKGMVRGETVDVILRRLWGLRGSMQREGQAHSPTKSESDSADVKPYKHTQTLTLRKARGIVQIRSHTSTQTLALR